MIKKTFLFLFSSMSLTLVAQKKGDFNLEELCEKHKTHTGLILNHEQIVDVEINKKTGELDIYYTDIEEILYLKPASKFYTDQSISLSEFFESLVDLSAVVYSPEGKKKFKFDRDDARIVDTPPSSWVFHDDDKDIVFDLKELGKGYRTVISYRKKINHPEFFETFHFISGYPVEKASVVINVPAGTNITFYERNMDGFKFEKNEIASKKGAKTYTWTIRDLAAWKKESGSTSLRNNVPHLVGVVNSFEVDGNKKVVIESLDDLHKYFTEFLLLKDDESKRGELNRVVREITEGMETDLEKIDTIFNWVQENIKYIAFEDGINGYVPRPCSAVMKNRYGDCKDMGNLLVEMLTFAGVKGAHVAWVGTRDIPYQMSEIPSPITCNHVICVVDKPDGGYYYLDATSSEGTIHYPSEGIQSKELLIHIDENNYKLHKVEPVHADKNRTHTFMRYTFNDMDSIHGQGWESYSGYEREEEALEFEGLNAKDKLEYVKELAVGGRSRYSLKTWKIKNLKDKKKEIVLEYTFSAANPAIMDGDRILLNPTLFKPRLTRYNKEDYNYPRKKWHHRTRSYLYEFVVPKDYQVVHVPENVAHEHELFNFQANFENQDSLVTIEMAYQYHLLEIPPSLFEDWNQLSDKIRFATRQNIILTRKKESQNG